MTRLYKYSESLELEPDDDVWAVFARIDPLLRKKFQSEMEATTIFSAEAAYRLDDAGGTFKAKTLDEARSEAEQSRHPLNSIMFIVMRLPTDAQSEIYVAVAASNLNSSPRRIDVHVHLEAEDAATGLTKTLVEEIKYAKATPAAKPTEIQSSVVSPAPAPAPAPSPAPAPAPDPVPVTAAKTLPVHHERWHNNLWLVTIVSGIIVVIVGVVLTAIFLQ